MAEIPSSSPMYTPLKRRKVVNSSSLEPTTLFASPRLATQLASVLPETAPDSLDDASDEDVSIEEKSALFDQVPCSQESISSSGSESPGYTQSTALSGGYRAVLDNLPDSPAEIGTSPIGDQIASPVGEEVATPGELGETDGPEESDGPDSPADPGSAGDPASPTGEIPNTQWWEDEIPPPLDGSAADETIDTDSDMDPAGQSTQGYLKEILTESMVESLPLPPGQKQQVMNIYRGS